MARGKGGALQAFRQRLEHLLTWWLISLAVLVLKRLPRRWCYPLVKPCGHFIFSLLPRRRRYALEHLRLALGPGCSESELGVILRRSLETFAIGAFEMVRLTYEPRQVIDDLVDIVGREHLEQALKQGRGVIALSAHLGNFPLNCMKLSIQGYPVHVVVRHPKNPHLAVLLDRLRDAAGVSFIPDQPKEVCVRRCLQVLHRQEILYLQIDQHVTSGGVYVEFFGVEVPTYTGPAVLALRTGAPVVPMFILPYRDGSHRYRIVINPPVSLEPTGDRRLDVQRYTACFSRIIEHQIRRHPDQWLWLHRRWKRARPLHG